MITAPTQSITESLAQAPMLQADHERKQRMRDAWRSYRGEFERPLKVARDQPEDRKSTRLNSSHQIISYAVFCLKKKKKLDNSTTCARRLCVHTQTLLQR